VSRQLHINVNILNAGVFGGSWRFQGTDGLASFTIEHYTSIAKKAEAAKLDAVFLADGPVVDPNIRYRPNNNLEPTTVLARIAAQTEQIGLIGTLSSSYNDPVELARRLGDLDYLSGGRLGWNVVTTAGAAAARNFGRPAEPDHALRYRRAAAFTEQVVAQWDARAGFASPQGRPWWCRPGVERRPSARVTRRRGDLLSRSGHRSRTGVPHRDPQRRSAFRPQARGHRPSPRTVDSSRQHRGRGSQTA